MKNEKIKVLAIGDIHGEPLFLKRIVSEALKNNVDLILLLGDLTNDQSLNEIFFKPLLKLNKQILIIPGNHELNKTIKFLSKSPLVKDIHGKAFVFKDVGIFGAGGGDIGEFVLSEDKIFKLLKKGHDKISSLEKKIMITHIHPRGSTSEFSGFLGSTAVTKAIKLFKPTLLLSAHIHEAGGLEEDIYNTKFINVSRTITIFEI